jgi:2-dehydro-3-deoxygluconokinase
MGVQPFYKHFKHDGVTGPNMATVYSDRGKGPPSVVFYNRCNEAAAQLKPGDFDWKASQPAASAGSIAAAYSRHSATTPEVIIGDESRETTARSFRST